MFVLNFRFRSVVDLQAKAIVTKLSSLAAGRYNRKYVCFCLWCFKERFANDEEQKLNNNNHWRWYIGIILKMAHSYWYSTQHSHFFILTHHCLTIICMCIGKFSGAINDTAILIIYDSVSTDENFIIIPIH